MTVSFKVLLPYEITLFSNDFLINNKYMSVLLPYEITLFSNMKLHLQHTSQVLLPYEITLFSNNEYESNQDCMFYYLMKLHYSQT